MGIFDDNLDAVPDNIDTYKPSVGDIRRDTIESLLATDGGFSSVQNLEKRLQDEKREAELLAAAEFVKVNGKELEEAYMLYSRYVSALSEDWHMDLPSLLAVSMWNVARNINEIHENEALRLYVGCLPWGEDLLRPQLPDDMKVTFQDKLIATVGALIGSTAERLNAELRQHYYSIPDNKRYYFYHLTTACNITGSMRNKGIVWSSPWSGDEIDLPGIIDKALTYGI